MENEVPVANIQMSGKVSTLWSQVNCHKHREEATPFIVFGKLSKWESSVRKQMFNVCELSQESFLLPNLWLCSLTCEMYSTLQWCCSTHRDEGKVFFFLWLVLGLFCCVVFCLFETTEGYSLVAGSTVSYCGGFFCCEAQSLGTRAWVVLQCNLSICGSSTYIYTLQTSLFSQCSICGTITNCHLFFTLFIRMLLLPCLPFPCIAWLTLVCSVAQSCLTLWSHEL